ncbi:MAG: serine hydrolase domain-containing protein [Hyphomicrobiaceae bacterium]
MARQKAQKHREPIATVKPEDIGFASGRFDLLRQAIGREIDAGRIPGCVIAIQRHGQLAFLEAFGYRNAAAKEAMTVDTLFSIASMTKPIVSVAALQLFEQGQLLLGDPVGNYLKELDELRVGEISSNGGLETRPAKQQPTIQDLLRHTSGFTYQNRGTSAIHDRYPGSSASAPSLLTKDEMLATLADCPLLFDPGTTWEYGFSTDVLGFVVEHVTGRSLGQALQNQIFKPLGLRDTRFDLAEENTGRYARTFDKDPLTGEEPQVLHVDGRRRHWQPGGAGLVSTAADYMVFAQMLLDGGQTGKARILGRKTVELMTADHLGPDIKNRIADTMDPAADGYGFGLGVAVRLEDGIAASAGTAGDFYWSGVYGTYFWVDPIENLAVVFLAACPGQMRLRYRQLLRALVYQALDD